MAGDDRVRFCTHCRNHVFNLSGMRREEAEDLVRRQQDGLCVRYYRRADGAVMTRDCPVGVQRKLRRLVALAMGLFLAALVGLSAWTRPTSQGRLGGRLRNWEPFRTVLEWLDPSSTFVMGTICTPPPPSGNPGLGPQAPPAPGAEEGP